MFQCLTLLAASSAHEDSDVMLQVTKLAVPDGAALAQTDSAAEDVMFPGMPRKPKKNHAKVVTLPNLCVHALGDKPAPFRVPEDMKVAEVEITYKSGGVTCAKMYSGMTRFGCGQNYLGLVVTKLEDTKV
jgi:hypothetical protein